MKIYLSPDTARFENKIKYVFKLLGINKQVEFECVASENRLYPSVGYEKSDTFQLSDVFNNPEPDPTALNSNGVFETKDGKPDFIGTVFFLVNSLQEYNRNNLDALRRFSFKNSYQDKYNNVKRNVVQAMFDAMADVLRISTPPQPTKYFLSHDIDSVHGSIFEDGLNVLKKGRVDTFLQLLLHMAIGHPDWLNMDQIMKIESEYDCRSTFFWIVNKGKVNGNANADYNFKSAAIQKQFSSTGKNGFENGLHKSLATDTFAAELEKYGQRPLSNRYHYLKFNLPTGYQAIEDAGLKLDASLGFSEQAGFRNSYGLPFNPYNLQEDRPYSFVEVPLHIMDRTFFNKRMNIREVEKEIFDFLEANRSNCVLSVLWHNNFFTDYKYKGYLSLYKSILSYIRDNNFSTISQQDIINKYSITWP